MGTRNELRVLFVWKDDWATTKYLCDDKKYLRFWTANLWNAILDMWEYTNVISEGAKEKNT
jgi:hypothetical protein